MPNRDGSDTGGILSPPRPVRKRKPCWESVVRGISVSLLRTTDHGLTTNVSLDIAVQRQIVLVRLDRERLESSLVQMAAADILVVGMPALRVPQRQPAYEIRQFAVLLRQRWFVGQAFQPDAF